MALRPPLLSTAIVLAVSLLSTGLEAADSLRCAKVVDKHLTELPLAEGDVKSIRIIEKVNIANDYGPEIFGVDAWVRLNSCSGYLVLTMTAKCYVRQSYTRGDCQVEGLSAY